MSEVRENISGLWRRKLAVRLPLLVAWMVVTLVLVLFLWSLYRKPTTTLQIGTHQPGHDLMPSIMALTQGDLLPGNHVEVLQNGAFFTALLSDIDKARSSIHFETFVWWKGPITVQIAEALARRAREGIEVRVILDASGTRRMDGNLYDLMEKSGCRLVKYHPFVPWNIGRLNNRDHRKIFVFDGVVGYTGGHGIAEEWTGNAEDRKHYRDTAVRATGPIVNKLQAAFAENWIQASGEVLAGEKYFPPSPPAGESLAHLAYTTPKGGVSTLRLLYHLAIVAAQEEIIIQNPYFLPDLEAIEELKLAVERGVRVIVMMPGAEATDVPLVQHASHHRFGTLLESGVRIFEYQKTLLHQKVIIVDRTWSLVGSTNFDDRSLEINDEVSMGIVDRRIAAELYGAFENDLLHARELKIEEWKRRPVRHRLTDWLAFLFNEQL